MVGLAGDPREVIKARCSYDESRDVASPEMESAFAMCVEVLREYNDHLREYLPLLLHTGA